MELIALQFLHQKLVFTAYGFFEIDMTFVCAVNVTEAPPIGLIRISFKISLISGERSDCHVFDHFAPIQLWINCE